MIPEIQFAARAMVLSPWRLIPCLRPRIRRGLGAWDEAGRDYLTLSAILDMGEKRYGLPGLILTCLGLTLVGFAAMLAADAALTRLSGAVWWAVWGGAGAYCAVKFDALYPPGGRTFLKLVYLVSSALSMNLWALTYVFLTLYECVTCGLSNKTAHRKGV